MEWSDEQCMTYADGEMDADTRAAMELAMAVDPALHDRVRALQVQRGRVAAAYAAVLAEPVPDRLSQLLRPRTSAPSMINLGVKRAQRQQRWQMPTWLQLGGMAASLMVGVLLGNRLDRTAGDTAFAVRDGKLVAGALISRALSTQLASEPSPGADVAVQLSFLDKQGSYCRTFTALSVSGLACHRGGRWSVEQLASASPAQGVMRQAASSLPRAVLDAVDQRIAGGTLDAASERQARDAGWPGK